MNVKQGSKRNGRGLGVVLLLAGFAAMVTTAPARACDKHEKAKQKNKQSKVTAFLAGDKKPDARVEKKLRKRIARLEAQMQELADEMEALNGALAGAPRAGRRRDGRSEYAAPDHRYGSVHGVGRHGGYAAPHAPVPPVPPSASMPPMPPMPPMPRHGGENMSEVQAEVLHEFQERMHEWQEEWRERQEQWHARQAGTMAEWKDRMADWGDSQRDFARQTAQRAREMADSGREIARDVRERVRRSVKEKVRRSRGTRSRRGSSELGYVKVGESGSVDYSLSDEHADMLFKLLAPSDVRVIVSRNDNDISVRGTEPELRVLGAFLELLNWVDRTAVFERMTGGEQESRNYEIGGERAGLLYNMLAPNDVKVIVSSAGDDAVAIRGTANEHEVLSDALVLLHWLD